MGSAVEKFAKLDYATSATPIAAVAGKRIKVTRFFGTADADGLLGFDDTDDTEIIPTMNILGSVGYGLPDTGKGWFISPAGKGVKINLTTATEFRGGIWYEEVD